METAAPEMPPPEEVPLATVPGSGQTVEAVVAEPPTVLSPGSVYRPEWGVTNGSLLDTPEACQDLVDHVAPPGYFAELCHMPNDEFLRQYNVNLARQVAMGSQLRLRFEQEAKLLKNSIAQVARREKRIQDREIKNLEVLLETEAEMKRAADGKNAELVAALQEQVSGEEKLKAAFEEFKRYEDDRVEKRCAELDARLDALSIDFDEELYPHMLTAITGRRWVIGRRLCLAMMKCAESLEMRQAFADVVSAGVAKGMSEGLKHGVEHGRSQLELESIEAYDLEAEAKFVAALQSLKDLKFSLAFYAPWESLLFPNVLGLVLWTRSPRPLGLQPAYAADHAPRLSFLARLSPHMGLPILGQAYHRLLHDWRHCCGRPNFLVETPHRELGSCNTSSSLTLTWLHLSRLLPLANLISLSRSSSKSKFRRSSLSLFTTSIVVVRYMGIPISAGITASVPYVREKGVSPWLDLIIVLWAQRTWGSSSTHFLFPSPKRALMPSHRLLFARFTSPLDCGCLTDAKCCVIFSLSHQSLNGLSANCLPLPEIISPGIPKRHTMLSHTNFFTCPPVIVATAFA
nr:hypothetical protein [Tanacetum cinerariifolium]